MDSVADNEPLNLSQLTGFGAALIDTAPNGQSQCPSR